MGKGTYMIYLDNAATTLKKPASVIEAVRTAMESMGNCSRGIYGSSMDAFRVIYQTREKLTAIFHCRPDHVIFTCNATEALNIAIHGTAVPKSRIISTDLEHNSVLRPLYRLEEEQGIALDFVRADRQGKICYEEFEERIRPETRAIVCTHASNLTGNMLDIGKIGGIARKHGLLFIVDASQTAGIYPIDMEKMGIDIVCFTGHKGLMGPQGTGGLCIREGVPIKPWKIGGTGVQSYSRAQPSAFPELLEAGTLNSHGIAGLSAALDFIRETGPEKIREKELGLMRRFADGVSKIPGIRLYGDLSADKTAIVALNIKDYDSGEAADALWQDHEIAVRAGAHCAPRMHEALGTREQGAVRFSFSWFNTEEEIDQAVQAVEELSRL